MSTVCLSLFCVLKVWFIVFAGFTRQPQAFSAGADRETGVRASEMGARIQGVPRQHGRLHEPSGLFRSFVRVIPQT
jgi:hypothetical protein